ncbi:TraU family protein [Psychromonas sp. KJ10-2]
MYPVAETQEAHEIGEPAFLWGEWRNIPTKEDAVYMLWRWNDCCFML